jgi:replicative DNA helicase
MTKNEHSINKEVLEEKLISFIIKNYNNPSYYTRISQILNKSNFNKIYHELLDSLVQNNFVEPELYENFNYDKNISIENFDYYLKLFKEVLEKEKTKQIKEQISKAEDFNQLQNIIMAKRENLIESNSNIDDLKISSICFNNVDFINSYKGKSTLGSPTGLSQLDVVTDGIFGLVALTGVPGGGKTTLAIQTAYHNGFILNKPVLYISLEVNKKLFLAKLISFMTQIPMKNILKNYLNNEESIKYFEALNEIMDNKAFYVMDKDDGANFLSIYAVIQKLKQRYYEDFGEKTEVLVILDYLNLFHDYGTTERGLDVNQKVAKQMAKFIEIKNNTGDNFLLIAAKNKQGYKTAELSSIKGSNDQEYAFETIISLEKPTNLDEELLEGANIFATILKSRWGEAFVNIPLHFEGKVSRFFTLEELPEEFKKQVSQ